MLMWPDYPLVSLIAGPALALLLLYLIRLNAHAIIKRCAMLLHRVFRITARMCSNAERRLRFRNYEITTALVESLMERQLERRFLRIESLVEKDIASYQQLAAAINQQLHSINEDYESSIAVPVTAPEWVDAVDAIAGLQSHQRNSEMMSKILADLHKTVQQHQREVMREHRWTISSRHKLLANLQPKWRKLGKLLETIDRNIVDLHKRLHQVDQHMGQYELLTAGTRQGLMASMLVRFVVALSFVSIGVGAILVNMNLLQQPFTQILLQHSFGDISFTTLATVMHIAITLMGSAMITESLRITHFFPFISGITQRSRNVILTAGCTLLLLMSVSEGLMLINESTVAATVEVNFISLLVLLCLGLAMPLVVALVLIPLEYLIYTARPVLGTVTQIVLQLCVLLCRVAGSAMLELGRLVVLLYDVLIFIPLGCESAWRYRHQQSKQDKQSTVEPPTIKQPEIETELLNVTALRFNEEKRRDKNPSR